jgi:uncharacterized membrane protein
MSHTWLRWIPAQTTPWLIGLVGLCIAIAVIARIVWGRGLVHRQWTLLLLRCSSIAIVTLILLGPTWVEQSSPTLQRPKMLFLYDGSSSMKLGTTSSRWQDSLDFVNNALQSSPKDAQGDCQSFRFGHRLGPLIPENNKGTKGKPNRDDQLTLASFSNANEKSTAIPPPEATDTRLADALRELSSRMDAKNTAGVVLMSDGRVRGSESVEQLASLLGKRNIPIHVVPVGNSTGTGDVAIISMVTQPSVRKYTENEIQVFLRSFGMASKNTTVRIVDADDSSANTIASVPIVLTGNAQSVSLLYNIADQPKNFRVIVDPIDGELTTRNNDVTFKVSIDRTRVRVLYIEGNTNSRGVIGQFLGDAFGIAAPASNEGFTVTNALREDADIECSAFDSPGGVTAPQRIVDPTNSTNRVFPTTRSELFSFDCIILSNVGPDVLEQEQQEMISQWIEGRGAGLIITGSDGLVRERWLDSPLVRALPIVADSIANGSDQATELKIQNKLHPIWKLMKESNVNDNLLKTLPALQMSAHGIKTKPGVDVLATAGNSNEPMVVTQRFGRGRVLLSVPALGGGMGSPLHRDWGQQGKRSASKLWRNLVYWATEGSSIGRRRVTVEADKRFYRPGDAMTFRAIAYNEDASRTTNYSLWGMFEPLSMEDTSLYAPAMWPEGVRRESGETSPRIAWGEELPFQPQGANDSYNLTLSLNEVNDGSQGGLRMELTAYERDASSGDSKDSKMFGHGTQVDSLSTEIHVLSDPFEQQNPLPNHDLLQRVAAVSGGKVLTKPSELAELLQARSVVELNPIQTQNPAWSQWWLWGLLGILISSEWIARRLKGFA